MPNADKAIMGDGAVGPILRPIEATQRPRPAFGAVARLFLFFTLLGATIVVFHHVVISGLHKVRTSKFGSMNRIVRGEVNADIVINGSSRALTHYDPRVLSSLTGMSAYNIGMNGIQTDVQGAILKTYLRHNRKPLLVIQNLEVFTFEATRRGELYDPGLYIPYLAESDLYDTLIAIDPAVWKWKHVPLYGYAVEDIRFTWLAGLLGHIGYSGTEDYYSGFNPRNIGWTEDFDRFRQSVPNGIEYRIEPRGVRALIDILATCHNLGIPVLLVYSPEYHEMQRLERNRLQVFSMFRKIAARFGADLWDYSDSSITRDRDNFYNSQHLNAAGAEVFSADLARRLLRETTVFATRQGGNGAPRAGQ